MSESIINKAREFAIAKHGEQRYGEHPYVYHLDIAVNAIIAYGQGTMSDPELVAAVYLHDVLEDCAVSREEIALEFGDRVATLVWAVTDEPGVNRKTRKAATYPKIRLTPGATAIKLADRVANLSEALNTKSSLLGMYLKEHESFVENLQVRGEHDDLWNVLFHLIERAKNEI